ncbi:9344_t:CDS:2, partial [Cetraspora pellucida]
LHVAAPILLGDENAEQELIFTDFNYQISNDSDVEEGTKHENQFENKDDEILLSGEWEADFSLEGREKHSANNKMAKWPLDLLIVSSLEMPLYFDSELANF